MTENQPVPDLSALERAPRQSSSKPPRRRWIFYAIPAAILFLFTALLFFNLGDLLTGTLEVTVLRPRAGTGPVASGRLAFQAAGWVEPDPFPLLVVPLTDGVVQEVLVEESDQVAAGDVIARLVADDTALELEQAEAALAVAQAGRDRAAVDLLYVTQDFEEAIALSERVAVARARAEGRRAEAKLEAQAARRATAEVQLAQEELVLQQYLAQEGAAGPRQVEVAEAKLEAARASREGAEARVVRALAEQQAAAAQLTAALRDQELRIEDHRRVELARKSLEQAEAALREARALLDLARLRKDRVEVRSPWDGIVLERLALPGNSVSGAKSVICSLYDPGSLRARVDVPFEEVARTFVGQRAEILCATRPRHPYLGTVLRRVQKADIQKVTLEVQVRFDEPDASVRPDMLCQVRFLAKETGTSLTPGAQPVLVPSRLMRADGQLLVVDPDGERALLQTVQVGVRGPDWTEIISGLNLTHRLIDMGHQQVEDGQPIEIREEH